MGMEIASKEFVDENKGSSVKYDYCGYSGNYAGRYDGPFGPVPYFYLALGYIRQINCSHTEAFKITGILFYGLLFYGRVEEGDYQIALINKPDVQISNIDIFGPSDILAITNKTYNIAKDKEIFNIALKILNPITIDADVGIANIFPNMCFVAVEDNKDGTYSRKALGGYMIKTDNAESTTTDPQFTTDGPLKMFSLHSTTSYALNFAKYFGVVLQTAPADDLTD